MYYAVTVSISTTQYIIVKCQFTFNTMHIRQIGLGVPLNILQLLKDPCLIHFKILISLISTYTSHMYLPTIMSIVQHTKLYLTTKKS